MVLGNNLHLSELAAFNILEISSVLLANRLILSAIL